MNKKYRCDVIGNSIRLFDLFDEGGVITEFNGNFRVIGNKRLVRVHFYGKRPKVVMSKYKCVVYSIPLNRRIRKDLIDIFINLSEQ